jgi:hypothetical protein
MINPKLENKSLKDKLNFNQNKTTTIMENLAILIPKGHHLLLTKWESCHDKGVLKVKWS